MVRTKVDRHDAGAYLPLKPRVLEALVVLSHGPLHGYAIKQALAERTAGRIDLGPGTLYRTIRSLETDGLVEEVANTVSGLRDTDDRRRTYRLTALGRDVLDEETRRLAALIEEAQGGAG